MRHKKNRIIAETLAAELLCCYETFKRPFCLDQDFVGVRQAESAHKSGRAPLLWKAFEAFEDLFHIPMVHGGSLLVFGLGVAVACGSYARFPIQRINNQSRIVGNSPQIGRSGITNRLLSRIFCKCLTILDHFAHIRKVRQAYPFDIGFEHRLQFSQFSGIRACYQYPSYMFIHGVQVYAIYRADANASPSADLNLYGFSRYG